MENPGKRGIHLVPPAFFRYNDLAAASVKSAFAGAAA